MNRLRAPFFIVLCFVALGPSRGLAFSVEGFEIKGLSSSIIAITEKESDFEDEDVVSCIYDGKDSTVRLVAYKMPEVGKSVAKLEALKTFTVYALSKKPKCTPMKEATKTLAEGKAFWKAKGVDLQGSPKAIKFNPTPDVDCRINSKACLANDKDFQIDGTKVHLHLTVKLSDGNGGNDKFGEMEFGSQVTFDYSGEWTIGKSKIPFQLKVLPTGGNAVQMIREAALLSQHGQIIAVFTEGYQYADAGDIKRVALVTRLK